MNRIRLGIIGTNKISEWLIRGSRFDKRCTISAVCSRSMERAKEFAYEHDIPHCFDSVEKLAMSPEVDAVYIATPNSFHARHSIICMRYGKHVLCEKPLASNAKEVREMIDASEKYGVVLMEGMKTTVTPNFKNIISNIGNIGVIRRYFSSYCQYSSRYDNFKKGSVQNAFNPEFSNGAVMDIGVYTIYPMVVLFGKPLEISVSGTMLSSGVDGQGAAIFRYEQMDAAVIYSRIANSYLPSEIQCEDATISIKDIHNMKEIAVSSGKNTFNTMWNHNEYIDEYYYEIAEFIDVILSGSIESKINSHRNSLITIEIIDEIRKQINLRFPADFRS